MKKLLIICLVVSLLTLQAPAVFAQTVKVDSQLLQVNESQLIKLAAQEKFDSLVAVMQKLVQVNISKDQGKIELEKINVIDFEYGEKEMLDIYYQLLADN